MILKVMPVKGDKALYLMKSEKRKGDRYPRKETVEFFGYLSELEARAFRNGPQLDLFAGTAESPETFAEDDALEQPDARDCFVSSVADVDVDELTPRQALALIYELRQKAKDLEEN